jgi:phospholipid transport system substrate-binding protein
MKPTCNAPSESARAPFRGRFSNDSTSGPCAREKPAPGIPQSGMLQRQRTTLMRRTIIVVLGVLVLIAPCGPRHAWGQSSPDAVAFVRTTSDQLIAIVNAPGSRDDKRRRLQQVIDATVDVENVAHFCLGRFWQVATSDQRQQYLARFRDLMVTEISGHLGDYRGVQIGMGQARTNADTAIVATTVVRPNNPTTQVEWVVSSRTGSPKIVDLLAKGTSMRQTHSADFTAFLAHHQNDVHELIEAMNQQIAQNK